MIKMAAASNKRPTFSWKTGLKATKKADQMCRKHTQIGHE
jgi:hypothetical protein